VDLARFEALVKTHQAEIYRYLRYLGADRPSAEDLVQETFIASYQKPGPLVDAGPGRSAAWLRGVARNKFLMHCRSAKSNPVAVDGSLLEAHEGIWATEFLRGGDGFDYIKALKKCLEALPEKQRRAVDLQYSQKRSRAQMAQLLQMTADGIKSLMRRIREALGVCIEKRLGSSEGETT
jgi:RNA polymerase sigma-70 factor (ECF subfamily)